MMLLNPYNDPGDVGWFFMGVIDALEKDYKERSVEKLRGFLVKLRAHSDSHLLLRRRGVGPRAVQSSGGTGFPAPASQLCPLRTGGRKDWDPDGRQRVIWWVPLKTLEPQTPRDPVAVAHPWS